MVTTNLTREHLARPVVDLVEQFGFSWEDVGEYALPDQGQRLQIRDNKNYAPASKVNELRAAMERGDRLPPVVVTKDGHLIDGNTRVEAAKRNKALYIHAIVLEVEYEGASDDENRRLWTLGAAFNARHGKGINRQELYNAVSQIGSDPTYSATRIAALIGVTDRVVQTLLAEMRARARAENLGLHVNGSVNASKLATLGRQSDRLHDEPYKALFKLVEDTGMSVGEILDVVKRAEETQSDDGAIAVFATEREVRRDQISQYRASGKSKPPAAAKLRQRLGFLLNYESDPKELMEHNPQLTEEYMGTLRRSIKVLQTIIDSQGD